MHETIWILSISLLQKKKNRSQSTICTLLCKYHLKGSLGRNVSCASVCCGRWVEINGPGESGTVSKCSSVTSSGSSWATRRAPSQRLRAGANHCHGPDWCEGTFSHFLVSTGNLEPSTTVLGLHNSHHEAAPEVQQLSWVDWQEGMGPEFGLQIPHKNVVCDGIHL